MPNDPIENKKEPQKEIVTIELLRQALNSKETTITPLTPEEAKERMALSEEMQKIKNGYNSAKDRAFEQGRTALDVKDILNNPSTEKKAFYANSDVAYWYTDVPDPDTDNAKNPFESNAEDIYNELYTELYCGNRIRSLDSQLRKLKLDEKSVYFAGMTDREVTEFLKNHPEALNLLDALAHSDTDSFKQYLTADMVGAENVSLWNQVKTDIQNTLGPLRARMNMIANPCYGIVDLAGLKDFKTSKLKEISANKEISQDIRDLTSAVLDARISAVETNLKILTDSFFTAPNPKLRYFNASGEELNEKMASQALADHKLPVITADPTPNPPFLRAFDMPDGINLKPIEPTPALSSVMGKITMEIQDPEYKKTTQKNFVRMVFLAGLNELCPEVSFRKETDKLEQEQIQRREKYGDDGLRVPQTSIMKRLFATGRILKPDGSPYEVNRLEDIDAIAIDALKGTKKPLVIDNDGNLREINFAPTHEMAKEFGVQMGQYTSHNGTGSLLEGNLVYQPERQNITKFFSGFSLGNPVKENALNKAVNPEIRQSANIAAASKALISTESFTSWDSPEFKHLDRDAHALQKINKMSGQATAESLKKFLNSKSMQTYQSELANAFRLAGIEKNMEFKDVPAAIQCVRHVILSRMQKDAAEYINHVEGAGKNERQRERLNIAAEILKVTRQLNGDQIKDIMGPGKTLKVDRTGKPALQQKAKDLPNQKEIKRPGLI